MTEIEKRLKEIEARVGKVKVTYKNCNAGRCYDCNDIDWLISQLRAALKREEELERQVCSLKEALNLICDGNLYANIEAAEEAKMDRIILSILVVDLKQILQALTSAPKCRHEQSSTKYNELLFAVCQAFPGESRHETALRYIQETEQRAGCAGHETGLKKRPEETSHD